MAWPVSVSHGEDVARIALSEVKTVLIFSRTKQNVSASCTVRPVTVRDFVSHTLPNICIYSCAVDHCLQTD